MTVDSIAQLAIRYRSNPLSVDGPVRHAAV
jgi:hypothetical protein